jgi:hypothetical protein
MKTLLLSTAIAVGAMFAVTPAFANYSEIPGSGFSASAGTTSGTDAYGDPWTYGSTSGGITTGVGAGQLSWGIPGLGAGVTGYGGGTPATNFEISFVLPLGSGLSISTAPSSGYGGYNEATRFDDTTTGLEWTTDVLSANEVAFLAPAGEPLSPGDSFFVNVIFNGPASADTSVGFSAFYTEGSVVPEPATMAVLGIGLLGLGIARRRRRG